jgi:hypothetical protein
MLHGIPVPKVRARYFQSHAVKDLGQRSHGNAADTNQMRVPAGEQIALYIVEGHRASPF